MSSGKWHPSCLGLNVMILPISCVFSLGLSSKLRLQKAFAPIDHSLIASSGSFFFGDLNIEELRSLGSGWYLLTFSFTDIGWESIFSNYIARFSGINWNSWGKNTLLCYRRYNNSALRFRFASRFNIRYDVLLMFSWSFIS